ncbi:uncharacterized, partial [Tachysurus ichikawai]
YIRTKSRFRSRGIRIPRLQHQHVMNSLSRSFLKDAPSMAVTLVKPVKGVTFPPGLRVHYTARYATPGPGPVAPDFKQLFPTTAEDTCLTSTRSTLLLIKPLFNDLPQKRGSAVHGLLDASASQQLNTVCAASEKKKKLRSNESCQKYSHFAS